MRILEMAKVFGKGSGALATVIAIVNVVVNLNAPVLDFGDMLGGVLLLCPLPFAKEMKNSS
jgi:hypothetical protein